MIISTHHKAARILCSACVAATIALTSSLVIAPQQAFAADVASIGPIASQVEMLQDKNLAPGPSANARKIEVAIAKAERTQAEKAARITQQMQGRVGELTTNPDLLLTQAYSDGCTLSCNAMILRRMAYLEGNEDWASIDDHAIEGIIWGGAGIPNTYEAYGHTVNIHYLESDADTRKQELIDLLAAHPEGLAIYDAGVPHAILLIAYDEATDTFLCADPSAYYSGRVMEVGESWNGAIRGSSEAVLNGFDCYWSIDE